MFKRFLATVVIMTMALPVLVAYGASASFEREVNFTPPPVPSPSPNPTYTQHTPLVNVNLNLPVTARTNTGDGFNFRITPDGVLQRGSIPPQDSSGRVPLGRAWENIADDVRTFLRPPLNSAIPNVMFYIKNDNTLWGFGSNQRGLLGDGTGVDRTEPILILDNVATVCFGGKGVLAIQTDGTLLTWGSGEFSPVPIANNVVDIIATANFVAPVNFYVVFQTSAGFIYSLAINNNEATRIIPEPVLKVRGLFDLTTIGNITSGPRVLSGNLVYINSDNVLVHQRPRIEGMSLVFRYEEIARNVNEFSSLAFSRDGNISNLMFIKSDGSLWGMGQNVNGELGDGTRVPRNEPIFIANNVVDARSFGFLKGDGTLWAWDSSNPTPQQVLENVETIVGGNILLQDGSFIRLSENPRHWIGARERLSDSRMDNVKFPHTITFE